MIQIKGRIKQLMIRVKEEMNVGVFDNKQIRLAFVFWLLTFFYKVGGWYWLDWSAKKQPWNSDPQRLWKINLKSEI